jgi:hypothetical protein
MARGRIERDLAGGRPFHIREPARFCSVWGRLSDRGLGRRARGSWWGFDVYFHNLVLRKGGHHGRPCHSAYPRRLSFGLTVDNHANL